MVFYEEESSKKREELISPWSFFTLLEEMNTGWRSIVAHYVLGRNKFFTQTMGNFHSLRDREFYRGPIQSDILSLDARKRQTRTSKVIALIRAIKLRSRAGYLQFVE